MTPTDPATERAFTDAQVLAAVRRWLASDLERPSAQTAAAMRAALAAESADAAVAAWYQALGCFLDRGTADWRMDVAAMEAARKAAGISDEEEESTDA